THEGKGLVTRFLKMQQRHHLDQMAHVKGISGWIESYIASCRFFCQQFFGTRHDVVQHSPPPEFFNEILLEHSRIIFPRKYRKAVDFRTDEIKSVIFSCGYTLDQRCLFQPGVAIHAADIAEV